MIWVKATALILLLLGVLWLVGCVITASEEIGPLPPGPPPPPGPHWVPGHWSWTGHDWAWEPGRWRP